MILSLILAGVIWQGGTFGFWSDGDNWSTGAKPLRSEPVSIVAPEEATIDLDGESERCQNFVAKGNVNICNGTLYTTATNEVEGMIGFSGISLRGTAIRLCGESSKIKVEDGSDFSSCKIDIESECAEIDFENVSTACGTITLGDALTNLNVVLENTSVQVAGSFVPPRGTQAKVVLSQMNDSLPVISFNAGTIDVADDFVLQIDATSCGEADYDILVAKEIAGCTNVVLQTASDMEGAVHLRQEEGDFARLTLHLNYVVPPVPPCTSTLRILAIAGCPIIGNDGAGEFVVLTNLDAEAAYDLNGVNLRIWKTEDGINNAKCNVTFRAGEVVEAGGLRIFDNTQFRWNKISDGDISYRLTNAVGEILEEGNLSQGGFVDGNGEFATHCIGGEYEFWVATKEEGRPDFDREESSDEAYTLTGICENKIINFYAHTNATLTLHNFVGTNTTIVVAGIKSTEVPKITLKLEGENAISTLKSGENRPAISLVGCDLEIVGDGKLELYGEKKLEDCGILEAHTLSILGGDTEIKFKNDKEDTACVLLSGNFNVTDGKLEVSMPKQCDCRFFGVRMRGELTTATLSGGKFYATVGGLNSSGLKLMPSGFGYFCGTKIKGEIKGAEASIIRGGTHRYTHGSYKVTLHDDVSANYVTITNTHPFKSDAELTVEGGEFKIEVPTDGTDGISSDDRITITGGTFNILTGDDCVNARGNITFSNGQFFGRSLGGDVLDANGDLIIEGGFIEALTAADGEKGLDVNAQCELVISGGTIIATGGAHSRFEGSLTFPQMTYCAEEISAAPLSGRYLVFRSGEGRYATKLPIFPKDTCSLLFSTSNINIDYETTSDVPPTGYIASQSYHIDDNLPFPAVSSQATPISNIFSVARTTSPIWSQSRPEVSSGRFIYRGESVPIPPYYTLSTLPLTTFWGGYETMLTLAPTARPTLTFDGDTLCAHPTYPNLYYLLETTTDLLIPFTPCTDWSYETTYPLLRTTPSAFYRVRVSDIK